MARAEGERPAVRPPFERVYEYALRIAPPGPGRLVLRLGKLDSQARFAIRIVLTRRGSAIFCPEPAALRRARRALTRRVLVKLRKAPAAAREVLARLGVRDVEVGALFYTREGLFRPRCEHDVRPLRAGEQAASDEIPAGPGEAFGITADGQVLSRATLATFSDFPGVCEVTDVFTEPAFRRRGMASSVVSAVAAEVLARGAWPVYGCSLGNVGSARLCRSLGFRRYAVEIAGFAGPGA
jgi:GNAT superfamily N-acetyltransferase